MTYSEAIEIMRYAQKCGIKHATLTTAMMLSQFDFPIEEKLEKIRVVVLAAEVSDRQVYSLTYLLEPFRMFESNYHKGSPPVRGEMMKVSDILRIKE